MENLGEENYLFPQVEWDISDLDNQGFILDLGGGGEGVIEQLK